MFTVHHDIRVLNSTHLICMKVGSLFSTASWNAVSCRNNWAWQAAEPGALITDNPLEEARDPSMGLERLRMFAICDQHAHTHTDTHSHTFLKLCSPSRRNVRTRSRTVLPTSDRKRQDRWQRWTDNSTCFPSQTNFLLCLGRRWGQTSRRIGGQGDKRIWQQSSIQSRLRGCQAYLYTIKSLKTWRLLTAAEEETRGFLRSVEELAHKQRL